MPSQFPPYSTNRHMAHEARRSNSGRSARENPYQSQQPYTQQQDPYTQVTTSHQQHQQPAYQQPAYQQKQYQQAQPPPPPQQQQTYMDSQPRRSREPKTRGRDQHQYDGEKRKPRRKISTLQGHFVAMLGEFVGTTAFLWFALAGCQTAATLVDNNQSSIERIFYISTVFGLSLLVCAWTFYRISGGLFNPAVTIGMVAAGQMPVMRALFVFPAQIIGGICAAALVSAMFPGPIALSQTTLTAGVSITRGIFIEMFLTFILVFTILMLAAENNMARPVAPVAIGLALFVAELAGVPYTGGSLNPARSFGPAVVIPSFPGYHYIYWFGPIMGALVAAGYYRLVKALHYEEAQPGQDHPLGEDDEERSQSRPRRG